MGETERLPVAPGGTTEESMIDETQWRTIRALRQQGRSKKGIARELGVDIKTVRKWLKKPWSPPRRPNRGRKLDEWEEFLRGRAPEVEFNASVLCRELEGLGYTGSYPTVQRYIRPWRPASPSEPPATVRFETDPGEQAQMDWGSTRVWIGARPVRVHLFVMVLCYSRRIFAWAFRNERLGALLEGHERALEHFGGCPRTILYDNPRTIVKSKDEGSGHVVWNPTFKDRLDFYGIEPRLCRYYRAQTKGKVESGVKYVKGNGLAGRCFDDPELEDLNAWLLEWCVAVADQRQHGTTGERPAERFARAEAEALRPLHRPVPPRERVVSRIVPRDGFVAIDTNRYPVPFEWVGLALEVQILPQEVVLHAQGHAPIRHPRLEGKRLIARWAGDPRCVPESAAAGSEGPPRFDPAYLAASGSVEIRSLASYEALCEEAPS